MTVSILRTKDVRSKKKMAVIILGTKNVREHP